MLTRLLICWFCGAENDRDRTTCGFCNHDFRDDPNH